VKHASRLFHGLVLPNRDPARHFASPGVVQSNRHLVHRVTNFAADGLLGHFHKGHVAHSTGTDVQLVDFSGRVAA
jgi:hypothetical protein